MAIKENHAAEQPGLVISYFGSSVAVLAEDGQVFPCQLRRNQELPVVGDRVLWCMGADQTGTIARIEDRQSLFARGDGRGKMKPIAANVDVIVIVMSPPPVFSEYLIDRYLIAAELLSIKPMLVINKIDLLDEAGLAEIKARVAPYQAIAYSVVFSSVYAPDGLLALGQALKQQTAVLVGPSGVGKSSIISTLGHDLAIKVQDVSAKGAGKHTTTATRLYQLPEGGRLIDSPGVREFNLWPVEKQDILRGFRDFEPFLHGCRFRDCSHMVEPGCGVQEAIADGKISAKRMASYKELVSKKTI